MNLNDTEKEKLLSEFFQKRLLPIAESAKSRGVELFPLAPDDAAKSYYLERADDGNYVHEINSADLVSELKDLWSAGETVELADLAEEIVRLAETLQEHEETSEEVSPFIYAMF